MGIFFLDVKMISKAKQSALAKASYVSGEKLYSERDGETKKYKTRSVKPESFILAPEHAPEWVFNREKLWNEAESIERNFNSQVMREIIVALPIELSNEQQTELIKEYVKENFVDEGMVADVNIHRDQQQNPHAHILLTIRPFNLDGTWWKTKTMSKDILDKNGEFTYREDGRKRTRNVDLTGWNNKEKLLLWRKNFAEMTNEFYMKHNIQESVSHLSYEEQGKEKISNHRLSRNEYYIEKKAKNEAVNNDKEYEPVTYYGELNKVIDGYNKEIEMLNAKIVSLEEYKSRKSPIELQEFQDIRKKYIFANGEYNAMQFVRKRSKSNYVDYNVARKTMDSLAYWKQSIDSKHRGLKREQSLLVSVKKHFTNNSTDLFKTGFIKNNFVTQYNPKVHALEEENKKLLSEFEQYKEAYNHTNKTLDFQKHLLSEEFFYLYPKYADIVEPDSIEIYDIMNKYVTNFKESGIISTHIEEFDQRDEITKGEQDFRAKISEAVTSYKVLSKQFFVLSKRVEISEKNYIETVDEHKGSLLHSESSREKIYTSAKDHLILKSELDYVTNSYEEVKNLMFNSLIQLYGLEQKSVIEQLPDRIKSDLLNSYLEKGTVDDLKYDLEEIKWKHYENKNWEDMEQSPFEKPNPTISTVGSFLSDLINQAGSNQTNSNEGSRQQRARRKRRKLTKEDILDIEG